MIVVGSGGTSFKAREPGLELDDFCRAFPGSKLEKQNRAQARARLELERKARVGSRAQFP